MSEPSPPPSLDDLDARLRAARARRADRKARKEAGERGKGLSFALRIGVEMVASLAVGVGIGIFLDRWLGTAPWFLLLFFIIGSAAGMLNVYRVMSGYGYAAGYHKPSDGASGPEGTEDQEEGRD